MTFCGKPCTQDVRPRDFAEDWNKNSRTVSRTLIALFTWLISNLDWIAYRNRQEARRKRRRGKRSGVHARLKARATRPPLPSVLLANVRALLNKTDEIRTSISIQRECVDCFNVYVHDPWLHEDVPDAAISSSSSECTSKLFKPYDWSSHQNI